MTTPIKIADLIERHVSYLHKPHEIDQLVADAMAALLDGHGIQFSTSIKLSRRGHSMNLDPLDTLTLNRADSVIPVVEEIESGAKKLARALREMDRVDGRRLDWLDAMSNDAVVEFGFEMEGGIYLSIESPGAVPVDVREMNTARDAIDFAMTIRPAA